MKKWTELDEQNKKSLKVLMILTILLGVSLTALFIQRTNAYVRVERITVQSAGANIDANLLYPTRLPVNQTKHPLVVYLHGIGQQRDFDLRIPIEFAKRGFYVAALDYQGQGTSAGTIANLDPNPPAPLPSTTLPATAVDSTYLLNKLETMDFWSDVNESWIGIIGHSLGGMVMYQSQALDPRYTCAVGWAPAFNMSFIGPYPVPQELIDFSPANLLNESNSENLLIIASDKDEILPYESQFLAAQNATGCDLITITDQLLLGNHQLYDYRVYNWTFAWFESHWFGSTELNGPVEISFWNNYILLFINIGLIIALIVYFTIHAARFFKLRDYKEIDKEETSDLKTNKQKTIKVLTNVVLPIAIFLIVYEIFESLYSVWSLFFSSIILLGGYAIYRIVLYFIKKDRKKFNFKEMLRYQFTWRPLLYAITCGLLFLGVWMLFTWVYPFMWVIPSRVGYFFIGVIVAFPFYLTLEILFRRLVFPALVFTKYRTIIVLVLQLIALISIMQLTNWIAWVPNVIFAYLMLLVTLFLNTFIYRATRRFSNVMIVGFITVTIFVGAAIGTMFGIGIALRFMVGYYVDWNNIFLAAINWLWW